MRGAQDVPRGREQPDRWCGIPSGHAGNRIRCFMNTEFRCKAVLSIGVGLALSFCVGSASALDPTQVFDLNKGSIGKVTTSGVQGSGVVIGPQTVLTNCHVVPGKSRIEFKLGNVSHEATLLEGNTAYDLCTLKVPTLVAKPVTVRELRGIKVGERVYAIGNPQGFELTLSEGLVSGLRDIENDVQIQTTAQISPGSSGGGLFDSAGRLIGITTWIWTGGQNLNFAMPAVLARNLQPLTSIEAFSESNILTPARLDKIADLLERDDLDALLAQSVQWMRNDGGSAFALTLTAMTLAGFDQLKSSQEMLLQALKLHPDFTPALSTLSNVLQRTGDKVASDQYLKQCAEVADVGNSLVGAYRALCRARRGDRASVQELDAYVADYPNRSWLPLIQSQALLFLKEPELANSAAQRSIVLNPASALAHIAASLSLAMLRRPSEAVLEADQAVTLSPKSPTMLEVAVGIYVLTGNAERAKVYYERLRAVSPSRATTLQARYPSAFR